MVMPGRAVAQSSAERLILERVARAERLLAEQRRRVLRWEESGLDLAEAQAVLKIMESITAQFHLAWRLFQDFGQHPATPAADPVMHPVDAGSGPDASWTVAACPPVSKVACPHCGLGLRLEGDCTFSYDMNEWAQRCRYQGLQTPSLCQLFREQPTTVH